jgi:hypothetical protein
MPLVLMRHHGHPQQLRSWFHSFHIVVWKPMAAGNRCHMQRCPKHLNHNHNLAATASSRDFARNPEFAPLLFEK